jgi:lauroyl/myristoyl acyltransferase
LIKYAETGSRQGIERVSRIPPEEGAARRRRPLVSVKDLLWFLYLYPLRALATRLGRKNLYRLGSVAEPLFRALTGERARRANKRIMQSLEGEYSSSETADITRRFVSNAIWRALDDLLLTSAEAEGSSYIEESCIEVGGLEHLERALAAGKGVFVFSGHFYGNRLAKRYLARKGYPMMSVRHNSPPDNWMGVFGARFLQRRYLEFLHGVIRDEVFIQDPDCSFKIFKRLRAGGIVNVHIDAVFAEQKIVLPFLNGERPFATGGLEIARLSGCAMVPMLCLGNLSRARILFGDPLKLEEARTRTEYAERNIGKPAGILEEQIKAHPDEWEGWVRL